jgi:hypothetical protein
MISGAMYNIDPKAVTVPVWSNVKLRASPKSPEVMFAKKKKRKRKKN